MSLSSFSDKLVDLIIKELRDHLGQGCENCAVLPMCEEADAICFKRIEAILTGEK